MEIFTHLFMDCFAIFFEISSTSDKQFEKNAIQQNSAHFNYNNSKTTYYRILYYAHRICDNLTKFHQILFSSLEVQVRGEEASEVRADQQTD